MDRIDEIKKRHNERKQKVIHKAHISPKPMNRDSFSNGRGPGQNLSPRKQHYFLLKCMIAAVLVLGVGVMEKQSIFPFPHVKATVNASMKNEFNFARVSSWYENAFGSPLAILPFGKQQDVQKSSNKNTVNTMGSNFAVPVVGQVTESFKKSKKGVTVQTAENSNVEAIDSGYVLSVTNDKDTGKTVVIQHSNGEQSIYGKLKSVDVKVYDFVKKKQKIGTVADSNSQGVFYFAIKEGNHYVDPIQVISFD